MKTIYLDTEFSEGFFKPIDWLPKWFPGNKQRWSIELISIGLVDDQGKEYYAINKDFKRSRCNDWVKQNVLTKLPSRVIEDKESWWYRNYGYDCAEVLEPNPVYKTLQAIKNDIVLFCQPDLDKSKVQFKAYYADYDWVLFCTIFGTMMDLPDGFPMYCYDLKQKYDEFALRLYNKRTSIHISKLSRQESSKPVVWKELNDELKNSESYPKQSDTVEHNALSDALWNKQFDEWLNDNLLMK